MASEKTVTIRLRADFVAWLEEQATQHNERMAQEGNQYRITVSDVATPLLQEAIERQRISDDGNARFPKQ